MEMDPVKIVLADAQYLARAGFRHLFKEADNVVIVDEAATAAQLETIVKAQKPDIVVFDYFTSDSYDIEDICKIKELSPDTRFLVVTADDNKSNIFRVLECGANSILTKNCSREEIINAVHATARKEKFFCNKVLDIILEKHLGGGESKDTNCAPSSLTARELEIVGLIAQGISTKNMAAQLHLSTHTIYTHRKNIMKKLGINSVSELVLYAVNAGIVQSSAN